MTAQASRGQITFRRVTAADAGLFADIATDVFDEPITADRLSAYLEAPGHLMVLALLDGVVVGQASAVIHMHPDKARELYVDEVGTASSHLRQGIATGMLKELFAWGRELGCSEAWLGTELDNYAAISLYRGFKGKEEAMNYFEFKL